MWITYCCEGRAEEIGKVVNRSQFKGVAQRWADRYDEWARDSKAPERYAVRWEDDPHE